jgi:hypothetical protein
MHHANHPRVVAGEPLRGCLAGSRMKRDALQAHHHRDGENLESDKTWRFGR